MKRTAKRRRKSFEKDLPSYLPFATEFTDDPVMNNPDWVVQTLNQLELGGHLPADLFDDSTLASSDGRPRMPGSFLKVSCAYVASKKVGMENFWNDYGQNRLWQEAGFQPDAARDPGFEHRPSYDTLYRRTVELELDEIVDRFERAGDTLIQLAKQHLPEIGKNVGVDATPWQTPSRLYHACKPGKCPNPEAKKRKRGEKPTPVLGISAAETISERHDDTKEKAALSVGEERLIRKAQRREIKKDAKGREFLELEIGGCKFHCLDLDAGARSYAGKRQRAWTGGYDMAAIDLCTGGTLANVMFQAGRQERAGVPAVVRKLERALGGELPETMAFDRGMSDNKTFRFLTRRGITPVAPWRKPNGAINERWKERDERWDEYGDPRCKHCGGPVLRQGDGLGLTFDHGEPVIRYRCHLGHTHECKTKTQQIACSENWRMLIGLPRYSERYHAVRAAHSNLERSFVQRRRRFGVAGKDETGRLKRRGAGVQRLRAAIARFLEWLFICLRHGWIGSHAYRNAVILLKRGGRSGADAVMRKRFGFGLMLPYGPKAHQLGLAASPEVPKPPWVEPDDDG